MAMLQPQMKAPEFKGTAVVNGEFKEVTIKSPQESCTFANTSLLQISLSDYAGKYVVLFFYPLDFTFVCSTAIIAFNDRFTNILNIYREAPLRMAEFEALGCSLIACSTDSHFSHLAW